MDIRIDLEQRILSLPKKQTAMASGGTMRRYMQQQFQRELASSLTAYTPIAPLDVDPGTLKSTIFWDSEQLIYCALEELSYFYLTYASGAFLLPGYPKLYYKPRDGSKGVSPNKSAVAAIGEGVAGLVAQCVYKSLRLARPNHDYPGLVTTNGTFTFLIEAKATTGTASDIKKIIEAELYRMVTYTAACAEIDVRPVVGLLVGTALESDTNYRTFVTEVRV